jgi:U3 small nucleolar RNA-associated protein 3
MGKRRNTAKTGDKAIYGSRQSSIVPERNAEDDHPMHNEIDRFHNDRDQDYLRLEDDGDRLNADQDDDGISGQQGVMDLGARGDSDSSDEESSQDSSVGIDEKGQANPQDDFMGPGQEEDEEESSGSESEEDVDDQQLSDPRNWGRKKSSYYHGDTADLEIGQDEEVRFASHLYLSDILRK